MHPIEEHIAGHIPGAFSFLLDELEDRLAELANDTEVIAYCRGANCVFAYDAVRTLASDGRSAKRLVDGMLEWRLANLPVTAG